MWDFNEVSIKILKNSLCLIFMLILYLFKNLLSSFPVLPSWLRGGASENGRRCKSKSYGGEIIMNKDIK